MKDKLAKGMVAMIWFGLLILAIGGMTGCSPLDIVEARNTAKEVADDLGDRARDVVIQNWKAREWVRDQCWDSVKRTVKTLEDAGDEEALRLFLISVYPPLVVDGVLQDGLDYSRVPQLCGNQAEPKKN